MFEEEEETGQEELEPEGEPLETPSGEEPGAEPAEEQVAEEAEETLPPEPPEDEGLDWGGYISQKDGIPDAWKTSPEDFIENAAAMLPEMKRLQSYPERLKQVEAVLKEYGIESVDDLMEKHRASGGGRQTQKQTAPTFDTVINELLENKQLERDDLDSPAMRPILAMMKSTFDKLAGGMAYVLEDTHKVNEGTKAEWQDTMAWAGFIKGNKAYSDKDRQRLKTLKDKHNFDNYEEAALFLKMSDPDALKAGVVAGVKKTLKKGITFGKKKPTGRSDSGTSYIKDGVLDSDRLLKDFDRGKITGQQVDDIIAKSVRV
jgi:hypothetical protein